MSKLTKRSKRYGRRKIPLLLKRLAFRNGVKEKYILRKRSNIHLVYWTQKVWGNCKKSLAISFANFSVAKQKQIANNKSNQSEILSNKCYIIYLNNKDDKIYK